MAKANNLYTKTAFARVPALYANENKGDEAIAYVKIVCPLNGWRWFVTEYDPETGRAFGLVQGNDIELGYFMVNGTLDDDALQAHNDNWRQMKYRFPPFERDLHFKPQSLADIKRKLEQGLTP